MLLDSVDQMNKSEMTKSSWLTAIFISIMIPVFGQKKIKGEILDERNKPISFANIGIIDSNVGSISNEDGSFIISIPEIHYKDTLLFSALGYKTRGIPVQTIETGRPLTILLSEKILQLEPVTVSAKKDKKKTFWLGNSYNQGGHIYADSVAAGSALALLIENKHPTYHAHLTFPVFVEKALLRISSNTFDEFKVRVRFLEVDSITRLPGKDLFDENLIVTSHMHMGWLKFDLSSFNFKINQAPFFLAFEWILDDNDRLDLLKRYKQFQREHPEKVTIDTMIVGGQKVPYYKWYNFAPGTSFGVSPISFSLDNYQCYYRNNSFGQWKRASAILTARLLVSSQPPSMNKVNSLKRVSK
jgi:hypothetical protein